MKPSSPVLTAGAHTLMALPLQACLLNALMSASLTWAHAVCVACCCTDDAAPIGELALKPGVKIMMMGTPEAVIEATQKEAEAAPEVQVQAKSGISDL